MKVKTFLAADKDDFDKIVNRWLDENKNIHVVFPSPTSINTAISNGSVVYCFSTTIWYEELESVSPMTEAFRKAAHSREK